MEDRHPPLWETATEDEPLWLDFGHGTPRIRAAGPVITAIEADDDNPYAYGTGVYACQPTHEPMRPRGCVRKVGLSRVKEIQAQSRIAEWADDRLAAANAQARWLADPRNYRGDWPEDH